MSLDEAIQYYKEVESLALSATGSPFGGESEDIELVGSIGSAIKVLSSEETDEARQSGQNELTSFVGTRDFEARQQGLESSNWNEYAQVVLKLNLDFRSVFDGEKLTELPESLRETALDSLRGFFFFLFLGITSDSLEASAFHHHIANCLRAGHFPAGWLGEYPEGKFVAY